jgi:hypothetical protein
MMLNLNLHAIASPCVCRRPSEGRSRLARGLVGGVRATSGPSGPTGIPSMPDMGEFFEAANAGWARMLEKRRRAEAERVDSLLTLHEQTVATVKEMYDRENVFFDKLKASDDGDSCSEPAEAAGAAAASGSDAAPSVVTVVPAMGGKRLSFHSLSDE